jgi:hypothetical protein
MIGKEEKRSDGIEEEYWERKNRTEDEKSIV